jgi:hypothetical protein
MERVTNCFSRSCLRMQDSCEWKFRYAGSRPLNVLRVRCSENFHSQVALASFLQLTSSREV